MFNKTSIAIVCCIFSAAALNGMEPGSFEKAFLFNVPSLLLEVRTYRGGIGFKAGPGTWFLRGMLDVMIEDDGQPPSVFLFGAAVAYERHFTTGKISPYFGGDAGISYRSSRTDIAGGDWSSEEVFMLELGPLLGIEVRFMENLSLFAEYELLGTLGWPSVTTHTGGQTEHVSGNLQWSVDLTLGNAGMIGLCIYF
ncbi:MAG: hypothetical protein JW881_14885 [Spirochaetales bacterium]|nr:hypothetical protein [Spirochaetales bacterium]